MAAKAEGLTKTGQQLANICLSISIFACLRPAIKRNKTEHKWKGQRRIWIKLPWIDESTNIIRSNPKKILNCRFFAFYHGSILTCTKHRLLGCFFKRHDYRAHNSTSEFMIFLLSEVLLRTPRLICHISSSQGVQAEGIASINFASNLSSQPFTLVVSTVWYLLGLMLCVTMRAP